MTKGPPDHAVEVSGLAKIYHTSGVPLETALNGIDLTIPAALSSGFGAERGQQVTLINILAGLVARTSGRAVETRYRSRHAPRPRSWHEFPRNSTSIPFTPRA